MHKRVGVALSGVGLVAGVLVAATASSASASEPVDQPPKGARAVVRVSPNPTTQRGQEITLTGNCGGGERLVEVFSGFNGRPVLENIRILNDDPNGFAAKANLVQEIGNGVGPIFVSCGDEVGVTLLVTHV